MIKLYVGNLPYQTTDDSLRDLFSQFGDVSDAVVIKDQQSQRSRGFGFVTFESDDAAHQAIDALHDTEFDGRKLVVNEAKPPKKREGGFRGGNNRGGGNRGGYNRGGFRRD